MSITLGTAALIGAVGAGTQLAGQGVGWLVGGGRKAKKEREAEIESAKRAVQKGNRKGWGPSVKQKNQIVNRAAKDVNSTARGDLDQLQRMEAAQGFGRSGLIGMQRENIARSKQAAIANVRGQVEAAGRQEAAMEKQAAVNRLSAARAGQTTAAQNAAAMGGQIGANAAQLGVSAYTSGMAADVAAEKAEQEGAKVQSADNARLQALRRARLNAQFKQLSADIDNMDLSPLDSIPSQ